MSIVRGEEDDSRGLGNWADVGDFLLASIDYFAI